MIKENFFCKHLKKVMNDEACRVCRENGNEVRRQYDFSTDFLTRSECQRANATVEIPEEYVIYAPMVGYCITKKGEN